MLRRALHMLAFPFLADPPVPSHEKYKGIIEYPGFHTTSSFSIAAMYAIGRVDQNFTAYPDEDESAYVTDYPVVVSLTMTDYEKHTDYDAEVFVRDSLDVQLGELVKELDEDATDEDIENLLQQYVEMEEYQSSEYNTDPLDFLSETTFMHFSSPLSVLLDRPNAAEIVREYTRTGNVPRDLLMEMADQFRYVDDIDESKITAVYYVKPVANEMSDYELEDYDEEAFAERWPGFQEIGPNEAYGFGFDPESELVWGETQSGDEYHGTTYQRLLSAAPDLAAVLPAPPSPPYEPSIGREGQLFAPSPSQYDRGLFGEDQAPWEMTQQEFVTSRRGASSWLASWERHSGLDPTDPENIRKAEDLAKEKHKDSVYEALYRGDPVSDEILADYPEFAQMQESIEGVSLSQINIDDIRKPNHVYRGMSQAEFEATVGAGAGVFSDKRCSFSGEGTCFGVHPGTAVSYALSGYSDPKETGNPVYIVEVSASSDTMFKDHDEYIKTKDVDLWIPQDQVTRILEIGVQGDEYMVREIPVPEINTNMTAQFSLTRAIDLLAQFRAVDMINFWDLGMNRNQVAAMIAQVPLRGGYRITDDSILLDTPRDAQAIWEFFQLNM